MAVKRACLASNNAKSWLNLNFDADDQIYTPHTKLAIFNKIIAPAERVCVVTAGPIEYADTFAAAINPAKYKRCNYVYLKLS